jgi:hypothetical protein
MLNGENKNKIGIFVGPGPEQDLDVRICAQIRAEMVAAASRMDGRWSWQRLSDQLNIPRERAARLARKLGIEEELRSNCAKNYAPAQ